MNPIPASPTVSPLTRHTEGLSRDVSDVGSQLHMLEPRCKGRKNPGGRCFLEAEGLHGVEAGRERDPHPT